MSRLLAWLLCSLLCTLGLSACNRQRAAEAETVAAQVPDSATEAIPPTPSDAPPPEKYSTLPPGAFDEPTADSSEPAEGSTDEREQPAKPDRGLLPNAGAMTLTGVRLGMKTPEIYGRYPGDSGWGYDERFIEGTQTGVILAKPNDANARATEMTMLQDGAAVAFLRAVREDSQSFTAAIGELTESLGTPTATPPQWARQYQLFAGWRLNPDEQARFWVNESGRQLLTAGHNPNERETVYMLLDLPRMQQVKAAMDAARLGMPEEAPPVDPGWTPPPGTEVR